MSDRKAIRTPRGRYAGTATALAVLGTLASAFAAVQAVSLATRHNTVWFAAETVADYAARTRLSDHAVLITGLAAAIVGALLITQALLPAPRRVIELTSNDSMIAAAVTRAGLRHVLIAAADRVDGIDSATAKVRFNRARITGTSALHDTSGLADQLSAVATTTLGQLQPTRPVRVRVRLRRKDR